MTELGCKFDHTTQSYYTDGLERAYGVQYRRDYCSATRMHAQCWKTVEWDSLTPYEKNGFDELVESEGAFLQRIVTSRTKLSGKRYVEAHADVLGGKSLRNMMRPATNWVRRAGHAAPCQFRHDPAVYK